MFDREEVTNLLAHPGQIGPPLEWYVAEGEWFRPSADENRNPIRFRHHGLRLHVTVPTGRYSSPSHFLSAVLHDLKSNGRIQEENAYLKEVKYPDYASEGIAYLLNRLDSDVNRCPLEHFTASLSCDTWIAKECIRKGTAYWHNVYNTLIVVTDDVSYQAFFYRDEQDGTPLPRPIPWQERVANKAQTIGNFLLFLIVVPAWTVFDAIQTVKHRNAVKEIPPKRDYRISDEELKQYGRSCRGERPIPSRQNIETWEQFLVDKASQYLTQRHPYSFGERAFCFVSNLTYLIGGAEWADTRTESVILLTPEEWHVLESKGAYCVLRVAFHAKPVNPNSQWLQEAGLQYDSTGDYWVIETFSYRFHTLSDRNTEIWRRDGDRWLYVTEILFR